MVLAADLALSSHWKGVNGRTPGIKKLSGLLQSRQVDSNEIKDERYRSPSSVSMKVNNLIASHPNSTGIGLRSTLAGKEIVKRFIDDPSGMSNLAKKIRNQTQKPPVPGQGKAYPSPSLVETTIKFHKVSLQTGQPSRRYDI